MTNLDEGWTSLLHGVRGSWHTAQGKGGFLLTHLSSQSSRVAVVQPAEICCPVLLYSSFIRPSAHSFVYPFLFLASVSTAIPFLVVIAIYCVSIYLPTHRCVTYLPLALSLSLSLCLHLRLKLSLSLSLSFIIAITIHTSVYAYTHIRSLLPPSLGLSLS